MQAQSEFDQLRSRACPTRCQRSRCLISPTTIPPRTGGWTRETSSRTSCFSAADPVLAGPLLDRGLLTILEPETFVDQEVTEPLLSAVTELITSGAFDGLDHSVYYQELSRSRMGWDADIDLSKMIIDELEARGLARQSEDGVSVPLHPVVRATFLVLLFTARPWRWSPSWARAAPGYDVSRCGGRSP